jgi:uncharacterized protein (DUF2062 family)
MKFLKHYALRYYLRSRRFIFHKMLHADDPPHRIALGVAIGMFYTFTPFIGVQMVLVVGTAWLLRANKVVGVPLVWISNPATFVPIFYPCYLIGRAILGWPGVGRQWWEELLTDPPTGFAAATQFYWGRVLEIFSPLMLGCCVVGLPLSIFSYLATRITVERYRARRSRRNPHRQRSRRLSGAIGGESKTG